MLQLKPYQVEGVEALRANARHLNADEMGLGKTAQPLMALQPGDRAIAVVPTSLKYSWLDECRKWRPDLNPIVMEGLGHARFKWPDIGELVIVGYNQLPEWLNPPAYKSGYAGNDKSPRAKRKRAELKKEREQFNNYLASQAPFAENVTLIVDEAQALRSDESNRWRKVRILSFICAKTWLLTGSPIPRGDPDALWHLLDAAHMAETVFGSYKNFERQAGYRWINGQRVIGTPNRTFHELLRKHMTRRTMLEVAPHLPPKVYKLHRVDIDRAPIEHLESLPSDIAQALRKLDDDPHSFARIREMPGFKEFSACRRELACAKIPAMLELVDLTESNGERSLVFSAHRDPIVALEGRKDWAVIHGQDMGSEARQSIVRNQNNFAGVALTISSGGAGLNLGSFTRSLFVDLDWDITQNHQALARNYRMNNEDGLPRLYSFIAANGCELDELVIHKQLAASERIAAALDGLERRNDFTQVFTV